MYFRKAYENTLKQTDTFTYLTTYIYIIFSGEWEQELELQQQNA